MPNIIEIVSDEQLKGIITCCNALREIKQHYQSGKMPANQFEAETNKFKGILMALKDYTKEMEI